MDEQSDDATMLFEITMRAVELKQEITRNGPEDLAPVIFWWKLGLDEQMTAVGMAFDGDEPEEFDLVDLLPRMFAELNRRIGRPRMVAFLVEGYVFTEPPDGARRGSAREAFMRGDPRVSEAILINAARLTRASDDPEHAGDIGLKMLTLPFHYADGEVCFDDPIELDSEVAVSGRVPDALMSAFEVGEN